MKRRNWDFFEGNTYFSRAFTYFLARNTYFSA